MEINAIIHIIRRKGLLECCIYGAVKLSEKIYSVVTIFFLRIRGYDIDYSVILKGDNFFFQSTKHAVRISKHAVIGKHTRISCGGEGHIDIGEEVLIDDFTFIMAHEKIVIGKNSKIAAFSFITDFNHKYADKNVPLAVQGYSTKPVSIGENVWIGTHAIVLPGVAIGNGAVIGASSVVTKDIPLSSVAVGNPASQITSIRK